MYGQILPWKQVAESSFNQTIRLVFNSKTKKNVCGGRRGGRRGGVGGVSAYRNKNYRGKEDMVGNEFNFIL